MGKSVRSVLLHWIATVPNPVNGTDTPLCYIAFSRERFRP
jgi:hypothetical protein